jgi:CRISPR system Cascade subunit CasC
MNGRYLQLHLLTAYPPSNLNRDDLNRPKTAMMGGTNRLRVSSQCLKRNWRTSEVFKRELSRANGKSLISDDFKRILGEDKITPNLGVRTKTIGIAVFKRLRELGVQEDDAEGWSQKVARKFGNLDDESEEQEYRHLQNKQVMHFSLDELDRIETLIDTLAEEERAPKDSDLEVLREDHTMVDIGMFGRMLAHKKTRVQEEGAVQVAHALTVHKVEVEDDFFAAVDDLNLAPETGSGSAFLGTFEYGAGLFYIYLCVNREQLLGNLRNENELWKWSMRALTEAAVKVTPSGKRNSFGHHTFAHYVLAERGNQQPRGLHVAFLNALDSTDPLPAAKERIGKTCGQMDRTYGNCADARYALDFQNGVGTMDELLKFVTDDNSGNNPDFNGKKPEGEEV